MSPTRTRGNNSEKPQQAIAARLPDLQQVKDDQTVDDSQHAYLDPQLQFYNDGMNYFTMPSEADEHHDQFDPNSFFSASLRQSDLHHQSQKLGPLFSAMKTSAPMSEESVLSTNGSPQSTLFDSVSRSSGHPGSLNQFISAYGMGVDQIMNLESQSAMPYHGQNISPGSRDDSFMGHSMSNSLSGFDDFPVKSESWSNSTSAAISNDNGARRDSHVSAVSDEASGGHGDDKREKYREKNRVAAAKCRIKKRQQTNNLEEDHRVQSALNKSLKQMEHQLREELSHWRTQALQHTFCSCASIQEYNLRKAHEVASDSNFGSKRGVKSSRNALRAGTEEVPELEPDAPAGFDASPLVRSRVGRSDTSSLATPPEGKPLSPFPVVGPSKRAKVEDNDGEMMDCVQ